MVTIIVCAWKHEITQPYFPDLPNTEVEKSAKNEAPTLLVFKILIKRLRWTRPNFGQAKINSCLNSFPLISYLESLPH